jgi:PLP dependent protein
MVNTEFYLKVQQELTEKNVTLVAVSKLKPIEDLQALYALNHRHFGENYVQELVEKQEALPKDINWHFIGHLQSNKVKYIASFVYMIQSVDSLKLLQEIQKQAAKNNRVINVLLQFHIAQEETKFGFDVDEILNIDKTLFPNICFCGVMGMASFVDDAAQLTTEFTSLKIIFNTLQPKFNEQFTQISMGMSGDYELAIQYGSNMVRIGSSIFGARK